MKALAKLKKEKGLWLTDVDKPKLKHDDVLIKIKKTAVCGTDLHIYNWDDWAQKTVPVPLVTGHEFVGDVVEVGEDVTAFKKGDRVSGEGHLTCGTCRNCRAGDRHLCRQTQGVGYNVTGCFSEYFTMPESNVYLLADHISNDVAAILDPLGNAAHAALQFDVVGEDVLITGAGPVGLMAAAIAKQVGARYVVVTDVNEYRLDLAKKMGATLAVNPKHTDLKTVIKELGMKEGFDVGMEMSGNPQAFCSMLDVMNHGGKIAFMGIPSQDFSVNWHDVVFKSLTITGVYGRRMFETWYKMDSILSSGLDISPIITHHFDVDDYEKAFEAMLSGQAGKVILNWT